MRRAFLVMLLAACGPSTSGFRFEQLPTDALKEPALTGVLTKQGALYITQFTGGTFRLSRDGASWESAGAERLAAYVPDFQADATLATNANFLYRVGAAVEKLEPTPPPTFGPFGTLGMDRVIGREASGALVAATTNSDGMMPQLYVAKLAPGATDWTSTTYALPAAPHIFAAARPTFTKTGRIAWRAANAGVWELDVAAGKAVERVPCSHEMFRPTHSDYTQCQQDSATFAARDGAVLLLNSHREVWRIEADGAVKKLVGAELTNFVQKNLDGTNRYGPLPDLYADRAGRLWLSFRWGNNDAEDQHYLYVASASGGAWSFVRDDLPRNVALFGDGETPVVSNMSLDTGLLVYRVR